MPKESVNHPDHYNWLPGVECMDVVKHFDFCLGNVIKYVWRAGRKEGAEALEDLQKAAFYLDQRIDDLNASLPVQLLDNEAECPHCGADLSDWHFTERVFRGEWEHCRCPLCKRWFTVSRDKEGYLFIEKGCQ